MRERCSVLISTCDKYEDAWEPFFYFFKKYWNDCPYTIYANTEKKKVYIRDLNIITLNSTSDTISWSLRLKNALKRISTEYVVFY